MAMAVSMGGTQAGKPMLLVFLLLGVGGGGVTGFGDWGAGRGLGCFGHRLVEKGGHHGRRRQRHNVGSRR